jgi:hypothetical protein
MKTLKALITLFILTICYTGFSQAPQKINYQAVLRATDNSLISNQSVGMQISVLQGNANGTAVYVETQAPVTSNEGLIGIAIGTGNVQTGDFTTIDWANGPYFVKIETDPEGGNNYTITATSELMSVPYALHAKTAETVNNIDLDDVTNNALSIQNGAMVITNLSTTERDAIANPPRGTVIYNSTDNQLQVAKYEVVDGIDEVGGPSEYMDPGYVNNFAQTFTPRGTDAISKIDLNSKTATSVTLKIYEGEGNTGTLLHSQTESVSAGINSITLSTPQSVTKGNVYTIQFENCECGYAVNGITRFDRGKMIEVDTPNPTGFDVAVYDFYCLLTFQSGYTFWIGL